MTNWTFHPEDSGWKGALYRYRKRFPVYLEHKNDCVSPCPTNAGKGSTIYNVSHPAGKEPCEFRPLAPKESCTNHVARVQTNGFTFTCRRELVTNSTAETERVQISHPPALESTGLSFTASTILYLNSSWIQLKSTLSSVGPWSTASVARPSMSPIFSA
jgi:hypothetical protein